MAKEKKKNNIETIIIIFLISLLVIVLIVAGVSNSNNKYQISSLKLKESDLGTGNAYIVGKFKNNSNERCKPNITVEIKSGSFETETKLTLDPVDSGESETIDELCFDCEGLTDAIIKVKNIECE